MTFPKLFQAAQDDFGRALPGATFTVYDHGTTDLSTIYDDDDTTELDNPGMADSHGNIAFSMPGGSVVDLHISFIGVSPRTFEKVTFPSLSGGGGGGAVDSVNSRTGAVTLVGTDIPAMVGSGASHARGGVPDPGATPGSTKFLREDATWAVPAGGGGGGGSISVAVVEDQKAHGTDGGTSNTGSFATRTLNTIVSDPDGIVLSLTSNEIELGAGTYLIEASAPGYNSGQFKIRLYDVTNAAVVAVGTAEYSGTFPNGANGRSSVKAVVAPGGNTKYRIEQQHNSANANNGLGVCSTFGSEIEVYTQVQITKVA